MLLDNAGSLLVLIALCVVLRESIVAMTIAQTAFSPSVRGTRNGSFEPSGSLPKRNVPLAQLGWTGLFLIGVYVHSAWLRACTQSRLLPTWSCAVRQRCPSTAGI